MNWEDEEFETFLRQFRLRKPAALPARRLTPRVLAAAAVVLLAAAIPLRLMWRTSTVEQTSGAVSNMSQTSGGESTGDRQPDIALTAALGLIPRVDAVLAAYSAPPAPARQVDVSLPATPPRKTVRKVIPAYPEEARRLGVQGTVVLRLTVDRAGRVTGTERVNSSMELRPDDADGAARVEYFAANPYAFGAEAEQAATQWTFEPGPSTMTCVVSFVFSLKTAGEAERAERPGQAASTLSPAKGLARPGPPPPAAAVPAAAAASSRVTVGGAVRPPARLVNVNPVYPEAAKDAGIEGVVILEIVIGEDGSVIEARVLRSIPELDQAAMDAVLQWKYEPTLLNGAPVEVQMNVTINFTLR